MSARGPAADTAAGEVVLINLPSDGPYGVNFAADEDGNALVVKVFDRLPNGKFGPIQKHGGVHYGDVLFEINDTSLMNVPFADALRMVEGKNLLRKGVKFMNSREYYRKK